MSNYTKLMTGWTLNNIASWFRTIAVTFLIYEMTGSAMAVGIGFLVRFFPRLLSSFISGFVIDQFSKKNLMLVSNYAAFLLETMLYVILLLRIDFLPAIYSLLFLISAADALYQPARMAIIPSLFKDEKDFGRASAQMRMAREATMLFSTGLGGLMIEWVGTNTIFLIDGIIYIISAFFHQSIRLDEKIIEQVVSEKINIKNRMKDFVNQLTEGIKELSNQFALKVIFGIYSIRQFTYGIANIAFTMIVLEKFSLNEKWLGWSYTAGGIGAIIGGIMIQKYIKSRSLKGKSILRLVYVSNFLCSLVLLLMFIAPTVWIFLLFVLLHDIAMVSTEVLLEASTITIASKEVVGRISSLFLTFGEGAFLLGSIVYTFAVYKVNLNQLGIALGIFMILGTYICNAVFKWNKNRQWKKGEPQSEETSF